MQMPFNCIIVNWPRNVDESATEKIFTECNNNRGSMARNGNTLDNVKNYSHEDCHTSSSCAAIIKHDLSHFSVAEVTISVPNGSMQ